MSLCLQRSDSEILLTYMKAIGYTALTTVFFSISFCQGINNFFLILLLILNKPEVVLTSMNAMGYAALTTVSLSISLFQGLNIF